jgi:hypothetical protein
MDQIMTALIWNVAWLEFYFFYVALFSALYFRYTVFKQWRTGFRA